MKIDLAPQLELLRASRRSWLDSSVPRVGPYWMRWFWTVVFSATLAVGFTVLGFLLYTGDSPGAWRNWSGWLVWYGKNFIVSMTVGALIQLSFDGAGLLMGGLHRIKTWPAWQRTLFFAGIPLLCSAVGWPLGVWFIGRDLSAFGRMDGNAIAGSVLLSLLLTAVFHQFFAIKARQIEAEKQAAEAQLRLLQGQIEPHFLFNTLAGVISLIDPEPAKAKQMLQDFTEYLRTSLGTLRNAQGSVAQELELAEHYLRLLGARMDDRLRWTIHADEAARSVQLPPLLLQPLVENAIHHGLEPQLDGGTLHISATINSTPRGAELVLEVRDDGRGLNAPPRPGGRKGAGVALENIRERLMSRYGPEARLTLEDAQPGTRACIRLPLNAQTAPPQTAAVMKKQTAQA